jgi:hypothetical protein
MTDEIQTNKDLLLRTAVGISDEEPAITRTCLPVFLEETLHPLGVAVVTEELHMRAATRCVKRANARMATSAMKGVFRDNQATREEVFRNVARHQVDFQAAGGDHV